MEYHENAFYSHSVLYETFRNLIRMYRIYIYICRNHKLPTIAIYLVNKLIYNTSNDDLS